MTLAAAAHTADVYAQTFFELARKEQKVDAVQNNLSVLTNLIETEADLLSFMASPYFPLEQKRQLLEKICRSFDNLTLNFLLTILSHRRIALLPAIAEKYEKLYRHNRNFFDVRLTVSKNLDDSELESVKSALAAATGNKDIALEVKLDSSILGGAIIRYNDKVIDNSVKHRLHLAIETIIMRSKNRGKTYESR